MNGSTHMWSMKLAGIDIGTLTCRLLIAEIPEYGSMQEIESDRKILRLGEGVDQSRSLNVNAMSRVVSSLKEWKSRMQLHALDGAVVVATSAVREAKNREEFLSLVKMETGFDVEVLSGKEEARRTLLGIESGLPSHIEEFLGIDIGGGSTEFMRVFDVKSLESPQVHSLDVGVVRLTERELQTEDPPSPQAIRAAEESIHSELERIRSKLGSLTGVTCVGTAGTITTLAAMAQDLRHYQSDRIHNFCLNLEKIQQLEGKLAALSSAERRGIPGLEPGREEVILAGTIILRRVMQELGFKECLVSDYGLREGIVVHAAARIRNTRSAG